MKQTLTFSKAHTVKKHLVYADAFLLKKIAEIIG